MDTLKPEMRSWNMSRICSEGTVPEKTVRSMLHRMGYRFRLKNSKLPGKPDIILARYKTAIFVHGCFWHRHKGCQYAYNPKSRVDFWERKFDANIRRDKQVAELFKNLEWQQLVIWECEIKDKKSLERKIKVYLNDR